MPPRTAWSCNRPGTRCGRCSVGSTSLEGSATYRVEETWPRIRNMQMTVLGATGTIGSRISDQLEERGHQVKRASRSNGIDAWNTPGLEAAFKGDTVVVDCLNIEAIGAGKSREFFTGTAKNITQAAQSA